MELVDLFHIRACPDARRPVSALPRFMPFVAGSPTTKGTAGSLLRLALSKCVVLLSSSLRLLNLCASPLLVLVCDISVETQCMLAVSSTMSYDLV